MVRLSEPLQKPSKGFILQASPWLQGSGNGFQGLGFRVSGLGFRRFRGLGVRVLGVQGFRV